MKKSEISILLVTLLGIVNLAHANCEVRTDDVSSEILGDSNLMWAYIAEDKDCRIERMKLQDYMGSEYRTSEFILFTYISDPGRQGVGAHTKAALCLKRSNGVVRCSLDLERSVK